MKNEIGNFPEMKMEKIFQLFLENGKTLVFFLASIYRLAQTFIINVIYEHTPKNLTNASLQLVRSLVMHSPNRHLNWNLFGRINWINIEKSEIESQKKKRVQKLISIKKLLTCRHFRSFAFVSESLRSHLFGYLCQELFLVDCRAVESCPLPSPHFVPRWSHLLSMTVAFDHASTKLYSIVFHLQDCKTVWAFESIWWLPGRTLIGREKNMIVSLDGEKYLQQNEAELKT